MKFSHRVLDSRHPALRRLLGLVALLSLFGAVSPAPTFAASAPIASELQILRERARALEHGEGVPRDYVQASHLYCQAARAGDSEAAFSLGWMYANGRGLKRDDGVAAAFFQLAATQNHEASRNMLRRISTPAADLPDCMRRPEPVAALAEPKGPIEILIHQLAPEYGVNPALAVAIARAESNLNPGAVSAKNAQGVMQLIPETSIRFNVRKPFNAEQNIRGGLAYLRWLLAYFKGDIKLVAAGYNAGEGAVNRYHGVPPYAETRDYVKRILALFGSQEHPFDASVTLPSPELPRILKRYEQSGS